MSRSIRISPKHGLNPTIPVCFFCGNEKEEIVLMGKLKGDAEAPRHVCLDYEPCDKCKEIFKQGILLVGVTDVPPADGRPPIQGNLYPTGSYTVVREALIRRMLEPELAQSVIQHGHSLVDEKVIQNLIAQASPEKKGDE